METTEETLAIMFADIAGSSNLYDTFGDEKARHLIAEGISLLTDIVTQYNGTLIKTIGDEIMATYPSADAGVQAAIFMQKVLQTQITDDVPAGALSIRVGVHIGPVIHENNDIFGNAVNIAARIVAQAKSRQILVSKAMLDGLSTDNLVQTRFIDKMALKGIHDLCEVHEIIVQDDASDSVTANINDDIIRHLLPQVTMQVEHSGKTVLMDGDKRSITIGRSTENDVVVVDDGVSRLHARIEYTRNKFVLRDVSTNGTYVIFEEGGNAFVRRDEYVLPAKGSICLGRQLEADSPNFIKFSQKGV